MINRLMMWLKRRLWCDLGMCRGRVVSGTHRGIVYVGWMCAECHRVKGYGPAAG